MLFHVALQTVGRGAFGVVSKALYRQKFVVAVKTIETEAEKKAFSVEVNETVSLKKLYCMCNLLKVTAKLL